MVTQYLMTRYSISLIAQWHNRGSFNNGWQFSIVDMALLQNPWDLCCDSPAEVYHKFLMAFTPYSSPPSGQMVQVTELNASLLGLSIESFTTLDPLTTCSLPCYLANVFGPRCASRAHGQTWSRKTPEYVQAGWFCQGSAVEGEEQQHWEDLQGTDYKDGTWNLKSIGGSGEREREITVDQLMKVRKGIAVPKWYWRIAVVGILQVAEKNRRLESIEFGKNRSDVCVCSMIKSRVSAWG